MADPLRIRTVDQLWMVVSSGLGLVITDFANGQVFHPRPDGCPHVRYSAFRTKVIANRGKNGGYYAIDSLDHARVHWPGVTTCRSRVCGGERPAVRADDPLASALAAATGSSEVRGRSEPPLGVEALMPAWVSAQRIALGTADDQLVLCIWPGELRAQARAFYGSDRAERVAALIERDPAWHAVPRPHLAYNGARRADRFYFRCPLSASEYLARWSRPDDLKAVGGHAPESVPGELWPWLCERSYADPADPDAEAQIDRFMASLRRRRSHAHLRPGIELRRRCESLARTGASQLDEEVTLLVGELAATLRERLQR
jgi:hypothetical protein